MVYKWQITIPQLSGSQPRSAYIYLPDGWSKKSGQRYPVLYMFDGHNLFFEEDATYGKSWGLQEYMEKSRTQMIIAAVECSHDPDNGRLSEYSPYTFDNPQYGHVVGRGQTTMEWLINVFKPEIDRRFPTLPDRRHTFIAGSSMGGLMSLYAVTKYNHVFSRAAALSPSLWVAPRKLHWLLRNAPLDRGTVVYMDCGSKELGGNSQRIALYNRTAELLASRKIALTSRIVPGGTHNEASWQKQIPFFMNTLLYETDDRR
ncbi:MAG: alpha/beta hydrolase [Oscillospiraceae bacterium]|nr:alpha/beta hydrolase [Oscillospiraceae bacterium]